MSKNLQEAQHSKILGAYLYSCPNCGGPIGDDRLFLKIPCTSCLPARVRVESISEAARAARKHRALRRGSKLEYYARVEEEARRVEEVFEKATGSKLWSAQRAWVKRVLKKKSFAVIAPTGVGKTTFGVLMAVYFASRGEKTYIVVPTTPLVKMVEEKTRQLALKAGINARIIAIHSKLKTRERSEREKKLVEGEFDILITTARYMINRSTDIRNIAQASGGFRFVFVDDVDAVLKSGKSVDALLEVVGFNKEDIEDAWRLLRLRRDLPRLLEKLKREFEQRIEEERKKLRRIGIGLRADQIRKLRREVYEEEVRRISREYFELVARIEKARSKAATLVVSSATGRPRGSRVRLFKILLGFEAGSRGEALRNIVDAYTIAESWSDVEEKVAELVKRLGGGGLVYVPVDRGVSYAEELAEKLAARGLRVEPFTSRNTEALERFRSGEVDVLVGVAIYYGVAVRGLDLPERIRYAVFAGVPRLKFSARFEEPHPIAIIRALSILADHAPREIAEKAQTLLVRLRRIVQRLSPAALAMIAEEMSRGEAESKAAAEFLEAAAFIRQALSKPEVWESLEKAPDIAIVRENGKSYILLPDSATYIQASGRTSRLVAGGLTKGLSIVVADDERLLNGLIKRTKWFAEAEWHPLEEVDLDKTLEEIDKDRRRVRDILEGRIKPEQVKDLVKTALLIVESPNKARTIAGFFGRPSAREIGPLRVYEVSTGDYVLLVAASGGHVYELVKPERPEKEGFERHLLNIVEGHIDVPWIGVENYHGVIVAPKAETKYIPVYSPIARCLVCGHQWPLDPTKYKSEESLKSLECPICGSRFVKNSLESIDALRDVASEVDVVLIGTDPDTEGEKIGWDTAALIAPFANKLYRVEFHEVTRKAILRALHEYRQFDENLVKAQIVRRVEDRWIGFTLSPILWYDFWPKYCFSKLDKKIKEKRKMLYKAEQEKNSFAEKLNQLDPEKILKRGPKIVERSRRINNRIQKYERELESLEDSEQLGYCKVNYNLSAGRVQTPVLGWIVEATLHNKYERYPAVRLILVDSLQTQLEVEVSLLEYEPRIKQIYKEINREIKKGIEEHEIKAAIEVAREKLSEARKLAKPFLEAVRRGDIEARVEVIGEEEVELNPLPPYTTDTMLAEATARLRLGAPQVMRLAQDLFEMGFITYHRTDSTRVSDTGIAIAKEYLKDRFGEERLKELYAPRTWGEGGAHEAIRPTRPIDHERLARLIDEGVILAPRPLTRLHYRLYELIFKRFIASQMKPARLVRQRAKLVLKIGGKTVEKEVERYVEAREKGFLEVYEPVKIEERLKPGLYRLIEGYDISKYKREQSLVPPMSQSDAIRLMKERRIGRPSTYAKIIDTLLKRAYATSKKGFLFATNRGIAVYSFLTKYFEDLLSEKTTRELQEIMDEIERGKIDYQEILDRIREEIIQAKESYERRTKNS